MPRGSIPIEIPPPIGGFHTDYPAWKMPIQAIFDGQNVVVRNQKLYVRSGYKKLDNTGFGEQVMGGMNYTLNTGVKATIAGGLTKRKFFNGTLWTDITGPAWTGTNFSLARFVDFPNGATIYAIGVNGKDTTVAWDGVSGTDIAVPGAPIAKDVTATANRVIYGNVTFGGNAYPYAISYSAFNDHTQNPQTNIIQIAESSGPVVAVRHLSSGAFAIYTENGQHVATAQASIAPFAVNQRSAQPGPVSASAVVYAGEGRHAYLGIDGNIYGFDGTQCVPLGNAVRTKIISSIDDSNRQRSHGVYDRMNREIHWWWEPMGSSGLTAGITMRLDDGVFSPLHLFSKSLTASWMWDAQTSLKWSDLSGTWLTLGNIYPSWSSMNSASAPIQSLGESGGQTYSYAGNSTDDGNLIPAFWQDPPCAYGGNGKITRVDAIESYFTQLTSSMMVCVMVGVADAPGISPTYQPGYTFDVSVPVLPVQTFNNLEGRFVTIKFVANAINQGLEFLGGLLYAYAKGVAA